MDKKIPEEIKHHFEIKKVQFVVSKFEEYMLNDMYQYDNSSKIKLNRDVTKDFLNEIKTYVKQKRNIRLSCKGETRDGKSLNMLKVVKIILFEIHENSLKNNESYEFMDFETDIDKIVCGNQIEYRKKIKDAKFSDVYLIDENFFNRSGLGSNVEVQQLNDYNSQIAKKNISTIFITPKKFLNVGATLGVSTYGRDSNNWLGRLLVYKFKDDYPYLIGYTVLNLNDLFTDYGCYIYRWIGGCNNVKRVPPHKIDKQLLKHLSCVSDEDKMERVINGVKDLSVCPFYDVCNHPLCKYEHKKDTWIDEEMSGTLDERTQERFELSLKIILELYTELVEEHLTFRLRVKNKKDLSNKVKVKLPRLTNTKFTITESLELVEIIVSNTDVLMLVETLKTLGNEELKHQFFNLECGHIIKREYDNLKT